MTKHRLLAAALVTAVLGAWAPTPAQDAGRVRRVDPAGQTKPAQKAAPDQTAPEVEYDDDPINLGTDVVNVLFSVTDPKNRFIGDVQQTEVTLTEDGQPQQIFSFRREENLPLSVAMLIDVSSSQEYTFPDEKRAAANFLQAVLKPRRDSGAIVAFRDDVEYVQGMTSRHVRIVDALNRMQWESKRSGGSQYGATALFDAVITTTTELFSAPEQTDSPETAVRRSIILLTDGVDTASERTLKDAVDESLRAGIIVYAIGIGDRFRSKAVKRDVLEAISSQTGGRAYFPESYDDLAASFKQIEQELRSQYMIAYEPTQVERDGKFHEIKISLPSRADIKVFHRRGYFAPRSEPTPEKKRQPAVSPALGGRP